MSDFEDGVNFAEEHLLGTTSHFDWAVRSDLFLQGVDSVCFLCEVCGWWCGRDEESEVPEVCQDHDGEEDE